jgi:predicted nucleotidyltransferase/plasmid maintenance system antidote protein VapI
MDTFGDIIRKLREDKMLPLRTVAAYLDIDQAILSKIERGKRKPTREHVVKLAAYFKVKENDLMVVWLSDNLVYQVADEQLALRALQMAEEKIAYKNNNKIKVKHSGDLPKVIKLIQSYFNSQSLVSKAWLFGSYVRGEETQSSDIDILIDVPSEQKFTLFDIAEVQEQLQKLLNKKVDVVMINGLQSGIKERIKNEMLLIYDAQ